MGTDLQTFPGTASNPGTFTSPSSPTGLLWPLGHEGQQEAGGGCPAAAAPLGFQPWPRWAGRVVGRDTPGLAPLRGGEEERPCKDQVKP